MTLSLTIFDFQSIPDGYRECCCIFVDLVKGFELQMILHSTKVAKSSKMHDMQYSLTVSSHPHLHRVYRNIKLRVNSLLNTSEGSAG